MPFSLADKINNLLPQTQCTKCGYPSCRDYAAAIANDDENYNRCPPGGQEGVTRIAQALNKPSILLNETHGVERRRPVAVIQEALCIGCTLCIQACPVDAIMGAAKLMHTVINELCTGCDLCVAPCPVDCIAMVDTDALGTGWNAWSEAQAQAARHRFELRLVRLANEKDENEARLLLKAQEKFRVISDEVSNSPEELLENQRKKKIVAAAIDRANMKKLAAKE